MMPHLTRLTPYVPADVEGLGTTLIPAEFDQSNPDRFPYGAATKNRTRDLLITSELLYLLSYGGQNGSGII